MNTIEPIYAALVAEGFDPASVPPNSTRTERKVEFERWWAETLRKKPRALTVVKPRATRKRTTKRADVEGVR